MQQKLITRDIRKKFYYATKNYKTCRQQFTLVSLQLHTNISTCSINTVSYRGLSIFFSGFLFFIFMLFFLCVCQKLLIRSDSMIITVSFKLNEYNLLNLNFVRPSFFLFSISLKVINYLYESIIKAETFFFFCLNTY